MEEVEKTRISGVNRVASGKRSCGQVYYNNEYSTSIRSSRGAELCESFRAGPAATTDDKACTVRTMPIKVPVIVMTGAGRFTPIASKMCSPSR